MSLKVSDPVRGDHYTMTLRIKPAIGKLLEDTAEKMGVTKTAAIVNAIRDLAKKEGIADRATGEG